MILILLLFLYIYHPLELSAPLLHLSSTVGTKNWIRPLIVIRRFVSKNRRKHHVFCMQLRSHYNIYILYIFWCYSGILLQSQLTIYYGLRSMRYSNGQTDGQTESGGGNSNGVPLVPRGFRIKRTQLLGTRSKVRLVYLYVIKIGTIKTIYSELAFARGFTR